MPDSSTYTDNIQGAIQAWKDAGSPASAKADLTNTIQENYDVLAKSGYFQQGEGQQLQGVLKQAWGVKDAPALKTPDMAPSSPVQPISAAPPAPPAPPAPTAQAPVLSPAYDGTLAPARYIDPNAKDGDPLGQAMLAIDRTAQAYQAAPTYQTEQAHRQAVGQAIQVLQSSGAAARNPQYQQFIADAQKQGWDYSNLPAFTSHTFDSHIPASSTPASSVDAPGPFRQAIDNTFGTGDHEGDIHKFLSGIPQMIAGVGRSLAEASYLQNADTTATLQGAMGNAAGAAQTRQSAVAAQNDLSQSVSALVPGTVKDIASGNAGQIPGNYLRELTQHPFNFALNTAAVASVGAGGLLARAGALEKGAAAAAQAGDTAGAASLTAQAGRLRAAGTAVDDAASGRTLVRGAVRAVSTGTAKLRAPVKIAAPADPMPAADPAALSAPQAAEANRVAEPNKAALPDTETPNVETPNVETPSSGGPPPPVKGILAGNINLSRLSMAPNAKAVLTKQMQDVLAANPEHLAPRTNADTLAAAKALKLTPDALSLFAPDEVPQGVPAGVFRTAVRDLATRAATAEASAADAYKAAPTPENEAALRQASAATQGLTERTSALSLEAGRNTQSGSIVVDGFESALHDAAGKAADLSQVPRLADPPPAFTTKPVRPRSAGYGAKNKIVTQEAYQQALKDLGSLGTRVNSGIDPSLFKPAVTIGAYHLEAGARQFGAWAGQMRQHFPQASEGDLQKVYAAARAQVVQGTQAATSAAQRTAYAPVLADSLVPRMGRQGVSDFLNALPDKVLDKFVGGDKMTDAEQRTLAETHDAHLLPGKPKTAPNQTLKMLTASVRNAKAGRLGYASAKAAVQGQLRSLAPAAKQGDIAVGLAKLPDGDFHALANFYNRQVPAGFVINHKHLLQASLLSGPKTLGGIAAAHAGSALFEDSAVRQAAHMLDPVIGKLSGIGGPNTVQAFSPAASAQALRAGLGAVKEAGTIMKEGPTALQLRGYDKGRTFEHGLHQEFTAQSKYKGLDAVATHVINPAVRYAGRTHAALYHVIGEAMEARGMQEGAALKAQKQGGRAADYLHDADVQEFAREYRKEQMFQNANQAAQALRFHGKSPVLRTLSNTLTPFATVPLNLMGRGAELTGAGLPIAGARALSARLRGTDFLSKGEIVPKNASPAEAEAARQAFRRSLSLQAGRGLAGGAVLGGTGALLRASGVLNTPDEKAHDSGSLNVGANKYDIGRFQPLSTGLTAGGMAYDALAKHHFDNPAGLFTENPYLSAGEQMQNITSSFDGQPSKAKELIRAVGGFVGPLSPTLLSQIAAATDPSGETRKKQAAWDYLFNRVPGLRERLQTSGHAQPSNFRSTGPLSLLYPANVTPRSETGYTGKKAGSGGKLYGGLGKSKL